METRNASPVALIAAVVAALCLLGQPRSAASQTRSTFSGANLRSLRSQAGLGSSGTFYQRSYGVTNSPSSRGRAGGSGVSYTTNTRRSAAGSGSRATGAASSGTGTSNYLGSRALYTPNRIRLSSRGGGGGAGAKFQEMLDNRVRLGQSLRGTFGLTESPLNTDEPIASFALATSRGRYATFVRKGEAAMKVGQYTLAAEQFRLANHIATRRPETLLSLAHADFAEGKYASMAHYLTLTVQYFPELAAKTIQLRKFFRDSSEFVTLRSRLIDATAQWPDDATQWFALAYVQWFDGNIPQASAAMRRAMETSTDPRLTDAIDVLWDSCLTTEKVSGLLVEDPAPVPKARPTIQIERETPADPPEVADASPKAEQPSTTR